MTTSDCHTAMAESMPPRDERASRCNVRQLREFFEQWFRHCPEGEFLEIRPLNKRPGCRSLKQKFIGTNSSYSGAVALAYVEQCVAHGDDVYIGALPRRVPQGTAESVGSRMWLWGDVDYGTVGHKTPALYATRDEALAGIRSCAIEPTILVDTGGGFHAWWALAEEPGLEMWADAMQRLAQVIKADTNALDAPRILRVPGTFNFKTDPAREVGLVEHSDRVASVDEFLRLLAYIERMPTPSTSALTLSRQGAQGERGRPFDRANDVPIAEVVAWLGISTIQEGSRVYAACPVHGGHNKSQMVVGGHSNVATCFGDCGGRAYTSVDLTAAAQKVAPREAVDMMAQRFGFDGFTKRTQLASHRAPTPSSGAKVVEIRPGVTMGWEAQLARTREGEVKTTLANVMCVLKNDPKYRGKIRFNEMSLDNELDGSPVTDARLTQLREAIELTYRITASGQLAADALHAVAKDVSYHPVRQYLDELRWDGELRLNSVAREILGAGGDLDRKLVRAWFISAVARARTPGCKVDTALVLAGPQGLGKSSFFRLLADPWFVDTPFDLGNKDAYMQLAKAWIYELPEIEVITSQKHAGQIKGFVTSQVDSFRLPYARSVSNVKRSCVIVGTTNEDRFLTDATGSRRFWTVDVKKHIDLALLRLWRDQLWAEAAAAYAARERWWLEAHEEIARENAAEDHQIIDPWEEVIAASVATKTTSGITLNTIMASILNLDVNQRTLPAQQRVGKIMRRLGYSQVRVKGARTWVPAAYGGVPV